MAVTVTQLEGLYLAYFGRPADADGLAFYLSNPNTDIWAVAKAFSESPESQALYGATFNSGVINAIYENLFNRAAESSGVSYWSGEVSAGRLSAAGAAFGILLGAQNADLTTVNNKLAVCAAFTTAMDTTQEKAAYAGNAVAAFARSFIQSIDDTAMSRTVGLNVAEQEVAAVVATTAGPSNEVIASAALANASTWAVTADHPNFLASNGIADNGYADLTGLRSGATVETAGTAGNYTNLIMSLAADTSSDTLNLEVNPSIADDNDTYPLMKGFHTLNFKAQGVEHVNLVSTGTTLPIANKVAGWVPDYPWTDVGLQGDQVHSVLITGNEPLHFWGTLPGLTVLDASRLDAPVLRSGYGYTVLAQDFSFIFEPSSDTPALYVVGPQAGAGLLVGTDWDNQIVGGAGNDFIRGGRGADTLTGGAGNDQFSYVWSIDSDYVGNAAPVDTITDFSANTVAQDVGGAAGPHGSVYERTLRNGDVIDLTAYGKYTISLGIAGSAQGAATIVAQLHDTWHNDINAALDSTTGMLYLDTNGDGVVDTMIELTGVKTLTTTAFLLVAG